QIVQQDLLIAHALLVSAAFPECWYTHAVAAEAFGAITATPVRAVASATTIMPTCRAVMCRSPRPRAAADVAVFLMRNLRFSILFPLCRLRWSTRRECHATRLGYMVFGGVMANGSHQNTHGATAPEQEWCTNVASAPPPANPRPQLCSFSRRPGRPAGEVGGVESPGEQGGRAEHVLPA